MIFISLKTQVSRTRAPRNIHLYSLNFRKISTDRYKTNGRKPLTDEQKKDSTSQVVELLSKSGAKALSDHMNLSRAHSLGRRDSRDLKECLSPCKWPLATFPSRSSPGQRKQGLLQTQNANSFLIVVCCYLFERQVTKREILSAGSLTEWPQRPGVSQAESRSLELHLGLPHAGVYEVAFPGVSAGSCIQSGTPRPGVME